MCEKELEERRNTLKNIKELKNIVYNFAVENKIGLNDMIDFSTQVLGTFLKESNLPKGVIEEYMEEVAINFN